MIAMNNEWGIRFQNNEPFYGATMKHAPLHSLWMLLLCLYEANDEVESAGSEGFEFLNLPQPGAQHNTVFVGIIGI